MKIKVIYTGNMKGVALSLKWAGTWTVRTFFYCKGFGFGYTKVISA